MDIPLNEFGKLLAKRDGSGTCRCSICGLLHKPAEKSGRDGTARPGDREVPIVPDKRIQEMSFGEFEGLSLQRRGMEYSGSGISQLFNAPEVYQPPKEGNPLKKCGHV